MIDIKFNGLVVNEADDCPICGKQMHDIIVHEYNGQYVMWCPVCGAVWIHDKFNLRNFILAHN